MTAPRERGAALILAMMGLLMLSTLGAGLVLTTSTEVAISGNFRAATQARFAARAIADRAVIDLAALPSWDPALTGLARSTFADGPAAGTRVLPGGTTIDISGLVNELNCGQTGACTAAAMDAVTASRPWGPNNPRWQLYAWGPLSLLGGAPGSPLYLIALVGDDGAENDGDPAADGADAGNPGSGRLTLRALVRGPGGLHAALELTLARRLDGGINILSIKHL